MAFSGIEGATGANSSFPATTATVTFSTSGANRICVLEIQSEALPRPQVSTVTSSNLTWTRLVQVQYGASVGDTEQNLEIWWAYAPVQLTNEGITATFNNTLDDATVVVFAVPIDEPTRFAQPWDGASALPVTAEDITGTFVSASGVFSTQSQNTLVLAVWGEGISNNGNNTTTPAGWTSIRNQTNTGGVNYGSKLQSYYKIYTVSQQNTTVNLGSTKDWAIIIHALSDDPIHPVVQLISTGG